MTDLKPQLQLRSLPRSAWIVCGLLFLVPLGAWGVAQVRLSGHVGNWLPASHPRAEAYRLFREQFPGQEPLVLTWSGSSLDDARIPRFLDEVLGAADEQGRRTGGMPEVSRVRTPQEIALDIATSAEATREESLRRLQGVLVGPGALHVRLRPEAKRHSETLIETLRSQAGTFLKFPVQISLADVAPVGSEGEGTETDASEEAETTAEPDTPAEDPETPAEDPDTPAENNAAAEAGPASREISPDEWNTWAPHDLTVRWQGMRPKSAELEQFERLLGELKVPGEKGEAAVETSFFLPGSPVGLAIELTESGRADPGRSIELLKAAAARVGVPIEDVHIAGDDALSAAVDSAIPRMAWNPSVPWHWPQRSLLVLGIFAGAALACALLGSVHVGLFALNIAFGATLLAIAIVPLLGSWSPWQVLTSSDGQLHLMLLLMPPLLLALTLAMAIGIAAEWQQAASRNLATASAETLRASWRPSLWTAGAIATGLWAMFISPLPAIREFALHTYLGVVMALVGTLVGLPAYLRLFPPRRIAAEESAAKVWQTLGSGIVRLRWLILLVFVAAAFGGRLGLQFWTADTTPLRSLSGTAPVVADHTWIEQEVGGTVPVEIVVRFDREAQDELPFLRRAERVREIGNALRELPEISGTLSLADFLPVVADPGTTASLAKRRGFLNKSRKAEEQLADRSFARDFRTIAQTATILNSPQDELWRVTAHLYATADTRFGDSLLKIDRACSEALRTVSGASGESYRNPKAEVLYHPGASHHVTGAAFVSLAAQEELPSSLTVSLVVTCLLLGLAVSIYLGGLPSGALALAPSVVSVLGVFGVLSKLGIAIGPSAAVTATIALGIGVGGMIRILAVFRTLIAEGMNRHEAAAAAIARCALSACKTSLVLTAGVAVLIPCELVLISRFGLFMTLLVGGSFLANVLVVPSLLAGPLGWLLQPRAPKPVLVPEATSEDTEAFRAPIRIDEKRVGHTPHAATTARARKP